MGISTRTDDFRYDVIAIGGQPLDEMTKNIGSATGAPGGGHYVVAIEGGIHPEVLGPFATEAERDAKGAEVHRSQDPETDATMALDILSDGSVSLVTTDFGDHSDEEAGA